MSSKIIGLLNHTEYGSGQSILILHGLLGSARNWASIAKILSEKYHVITVDLRNHGQSPHAASMSYCEMANDVINLVKHLQLKNPSLIGHSMGGKVAMAAQLIEPNLFKSLISVDIAPINYSHNLGIIITPMIDLDTTMLSSRSDAVTKLSASIPSTQIVQLIMQNLIQNKEGFQWRINLQGIKDHLDEIVRFPKRLEQKTCLCPALFLGGERSDYLLANYHPTIVNYFPNAQIKMLADTGHWLHVDKQDEFLAQVKTFIKANI